MSDASRRQFLQTALMGAGAAVAWPAMAHRAHAAADRGFKMAFGLVTYMWGADWDLPTLIANCQQAGCLGVELRTTHRHGVEPSLDRAGREEVRQRFADSEVTLVGLGSNERFDSPDPAVLRKAIETTKQFLLLSHDVGSTGVKVKPDRFWPNVPREKTIEQIARSLVEVGQFGYDYGQEVRLEIHGQCAPIPIIKQIIDQAKHPAVKLCWNSNAPDLEGEGLEHNFSLVKDRFGATCHVRELDDKNYPFPKLIKLLVDMDYEGWVLLEASSKPEDRVAALGRQVKLFDQLRAAAQKG